jgi:hypothetical protein
MTAYTSNNYSSQQIYFALFGTRDVRPRLRRILIRRSLISSRRKQQNDNEKLPNSEHTLLL